MGIRSRRKEPVGRPAVKVTRTFSDSSILTFRWVDALPRDGCNEGALSGFLPTIQPSWMRIESIKLGHASGSGGL